MQGGMQIRGKANSLQEGGVKLQRVAMHEQVSLYCLFYIILPFSLLGSIQSITSNNATISYLTSIQLSSDIICILLPLHYSPFQNYGDNSGIKIKGAKRVKRQALSRRPYCFPSTPTPSHCIK